MVTSAMMSSSCEMFCCYPRNSRRNVAKARQAQVERERKRIHEEIEKDLRQERRRRQKEHRILLLGCGEAGKSTFIKQMRIIHSTGFTDSERRQIKSSIAINIASAICTLIQNLPTENRERVFNDDSRLQEAADEVSRVFVAASGDPRKFSFMRQPEPENVMAVADSIKLLWESEPIQAVYRQRHTFQLVECAKYFLSKVHQVMATDYCPTDEDIVQTRVKTEGIVEHEFELSAQGNRRKGSKLILIDVGGQRSERRKWIHCFEDVMLLIFLTAVSEFDQVLAEDESTNRIKESIKLFKIILEYHWFRRTNVILFLNKMDLLEEKLKAGHQISPRFPEFPGPEGDYDAAISFFSREFSKQNPNENERDIYIHATCATDTNNILLVDVVVQQIIMDAIFAETYLN